MKTNNPEEIYDLSTISRDDLRSLLSTAKDEWKSFTNCEDDTDSCRKLIAAEEKKKKDANKQRLVWVMLIVSIPIISLGTTSMLPALVFILPLVPVVFYTTKRKKKAIQVKIEEYKAQIPDLRKKEEEAMSKFDKVWLIPDDYCSEYAMATMIKFIDSNKAHSWKEVTALYDEHLYRMKMEENTRLAAEEAIKQTEIAKQTRNAARTGALGSLITAGGVLRINSKL
jgi:hypothetical protein